MLPEAAAPLRYRIQAEGEELHLAAEQLRLLPPPKPAIAKSEGGAKRSRSGGDAAPAEPATAEPATAEPATADDAPADPAPADDAPADDAPADDAHVLRLDHAQAADPVPPEPKRPCPSPLTPVEV